MSTLQLHYQRTVHWILHGMLRKTTASYKKNHQFNPKINAKYASELGKIQYKHSWKLHVVTIMLFLWLLIKYKWDYVIQRRHGTGCEQSATSWQRRFWEALSTVLTMWPETRQLKWSQEDLFIDISIYFICLLSYLTVDLAAACDRRSTFLLTPAKLLTVATKSCDT